MITSAYSTEPFKNNLPRSIDNVKSHPDRKQWKAEMMEELKTLEEIRTWTLVLRTEKHKSKLNKSIYGLEQAPRCWYLRSDEVLLENEFKRCKSDNCLYMKYTNDHVLYFISFVDDILVAGNSIAGINKLKKT
ncbi:hypothetical protein JTB14_005177 [Gonioctena quinquepunctata]|nr:hypothetical protein JTB14_005177 [Gonioctena quinquepunctata]